MAKLCGTGFGSENRISKELKNKLCSYYYFGRQKKKVELWIEPYVLQMSGNK